MTWFKLDVHMSTLYELGTSPYSCQTTARLRLVASKLTNDNVGVQRNKSFSLGIMRESGASIQLSIGPRTPTGSKISESLAAKPGSSNPL